MVDISFEYRKPQVKHHFFENDLNLAQKFSSQLKIEMGDLLKATILFGSAARGGASSESDIDIMLIINDLTVVLSEEVVTGLRIIIENVASKISDKFHITQMHLSEYWDYVRLGDPVIVNILRDGYAVYDDGFFQPTQMLLEQGKIRPSKEAVWSYYNRAPKTLKAAEDKLLHGIVDLYWACIDASHAALMHIDLLPGSPHKIADMLDEHFVSRGILESRYVKTMRTFYKLAKEIGHHQTNKLTPKEYGKYLDLARDYVKRMKFIIDHDSEKLKKPSVAK